jgi:excisionase family DNA binding protein
MPSATLPPAPPLAVPTKEASRLLSVSLSRLYELLRAGELDSYADGYNRRVTMASIHRFIERRLAESGGSWRQINPQPRQASKASCADQLESTTTT